MPMWATWVFGIVLAAMLLAAMCASLLRNRELR